MLRGSVGRGAPALIRYSHVGPAKVSGQAACKKAGVSISPGYDLLVAWGAKPPKFKLRLYWLTGGVCLEWAGLYESAEGRAFIEQSDFVPEAVVFGLEADPDRTPRDQPLGRGILGGAV